jgi:modulator of FtsH protease HflC
MKAKSIPVLIILILIGVVAYSAAFIVDETEQVVVTRFGGKVVDIITEPGLKFKIPMIDVANIFPKNIQSWDGEQGQIPTLDKTFIWVDPFARWKIVNPVLFFRTVNNLTEAHRRLNEIIDPAVRNQITQQSLIETVRDSNRKMDTFEVGLEGIQSEIADGILPERDDEGKFNIQLGRSKITDIIMSEAQPTLVNLGIELVDVKIKRINYVEEVRDSIYNRMIAERKQIAEKFRSEGRGEAQKILGEKERDLNRIQSEAYEKAETMRGVADAEAAAIYAAAYGVDPEFFSFLKSTEMYHKTLAKQSSIVLSTDSEFLQYLKGAPPASR